VRDGPGPDGPALIERASPDDLMLLASDVGPAPMQAGALLVHDAGLHRRRTGGREGHPGGADDRGATAQAATRPDTARLRAPDLD